MNLLPASIVESSNLGEVKSTSMTLEFADRSFKHPRGVLEDVVVTIQGKKFPVYFFVLDVEYYGKITEIPIILGRPFLATAQALKDYENGTIMFRVNGEKIFVETINSRRILELESSCSVEECWTIKQLVAEVGMKICTKDQMELALNETDESLDKNL